MKALLIKTIYALIVPCSKIPTQIERQKADALPFIEKIRLKMHLRICKWCMAYSQKVNQIDDVLVENITNKVKNNHFETFEIEEFKEDLKQKIKKM